VDIFLSTLVTISFVIFSNTFQNQFYLSHGQQQTSTEIDPKNKQAWVGKGDSLNREGNFSEAITAYNTAIEIDPNYVNALEVKDGLNELGNYSQAIIYLDKALEIDPNHIDALVFKSQAPSNMGNQTGANYYSDKAFEIDPGSPALKRLTGNIN
jgi:tetratricopeptide (TPR) repeat protein